MIEGATTMSARVGQPVTLTGASAPYSFAADAATNAELLVGPITDLNVMTRRGRYAHRVTRHDVARKLELTIRTDEAGSRSTRA